MRAISIAIVLVAGLPLLAAAQPASDTPGLTEMPGIV
jgi:hypothetical protein